MLDNFIKKFEENGEVYLRVKAHPGSGKSGIKDVMEDGTVKIDVAAQPVKGRANQELIKFLAKNFKVRKDDVKIISGAGDKIKLIKIIK